MATLEIALVLALVAASAGYAWRSSAELPRLAALVIAAAGVLVAVAAATTRDHREQSPVAIERAASGSVGSGACRSCHPSEYASWHRTFHRTMTQVASRATVLGPWNGVKLDVEGRTLELFERGDALFARLPDPAVVAAARRLGNPRMAAEADLVTRRILLTTGSHHQQVFWVDGGHDNELRLLPISYLIDSRRYVPRRDAFLEPPDAPQHAIRWNSNCIQCHATRGEPRLDDATGRFDSDAVELGIACEACHGPGAAHVAKQQSPLTRFASHFTGAADPSIVNPARLAPERASAVCGQCHSYFVPRDENAWWRSGFDAYRPGDALEPTRTLLAPETTNAPGAPSVDAETASLFWNDGTIRVGGREYNGMVRSACYAKGHGDDRVSCLSCHAMHASDPDDQLRRDQGVDAACTHCHAAEGARVADHTHHAPGSSGSSCVGCHMPYTSYALLGAIRSHRIDSPSALATATNGRPNACNLCHVDRTLAWTANAIARWYDSPPPAAPVDAALAERRSA
ncbi:MAG TPA: multiheme c-type cytochrome, partial [Polyangiaceae bacterium]|nr:multiheme c-type cytochrome [Polyangiaceae bacterium]